MAFPVVAILSALASDMQNRKAKRDAIGEAGAANTQNILNRHASSLGGSPYYGMNENLRSQFAQLDRQADAARNNQIGTLLQAYLKQPSEPELPAQRELIGGAPTIDDLPGAGNNSGLGMVDSLFAGTPTDMPSAGSLGQVDSLFGNEPSKLWEDDPWGSGAF